MIIHYLYINATFIKYPIILALVFFIFDVKGANTNSEKIQSLLKNTKDDYHKAKLLNELSIAYHDENNFEESIRAAYSALNIAKWNNYSEIIIDSYNNIAYTYTFYKNYSKGIENYLYEVKYLKKTSNYFQLAKSYNNIARAYNAIKNPKKAIYYCDLGLAILKNKPNEELLTDLYTTTGLSYNHLNDYRKEIQFFEKVIIARKKNKEFDKLGYEYFKMGFAYSKIKNYNKTFQYFELYLKISIENNDSLNIGLAYINIGEAYYDLGKYLKSNQFYNKALELNQGSVNVITYSKLVDSYCKLNNLEMAIYFFNLAERGKAESTRLLKNCKSISQLAKKVNSLSTAIYFLEYENEIRNNLILASNSNIEATVKAKYEVEGIEARIAEKENFELTAEIFKLKNKQIRFFLIILVLLITFPWQLLSSIIKDSRTQKEFS